MTTVALVGGGTAGHITPLLAVAEQLAGRATCLVWGTKGGREAELVEDLPIVHSIPKLPFPRGLSLKALVFPFRLLMAVWATRASFVRHGVDVVVGFGGYTAAAAYLAARMAGIPMVIHEANAVPGLANRLGAALGGTVGICFPGTPIRHEAVVGMPLRDSIVSLERASLRSAARRHFGLRPRKPVLLVTGGSTGAVRINSTVDEVAADIVKAGWQILHLRGPGNPAEKRGKDVVSVEYTDRMDLALSAADLAVSRAGATTVNELQVVGLPAVFIPYHVGNGEQEKNAAETVRAGGALLVSQEEFTPQWVRQTLIPLLQDVPQVESMAQAISRLGRRDGARVIAQWALDAGVKSA